MTNHPHRGRRAKHRARQHLAAVARLYPRAWALVDEFRASRGRGLPDWPAWCFLPIAGAYAIVSDQAGQERVPLDQVPDIARVAALAAWRVTQGIYRFDADLVEALLQTPISGDLPAEALQRLPEWCVYIETPWMPAMGWRLAGFFAHMEWDANDSRQELRLLLDLDTDHGPRLLPVPIHLGAGLAEGLAMMREETVRIARALGGAGMAEDVRSGLADIDPLGMLPRLVSVLLYLCADDAEIGEGAERPSNPAPKRTRKGWRLFGADGPRAWPVGVRLGAALRRAGEGGQVGGVPGQVGDAPRSRPRGHIRRAHWHSFWAGPRDGVRQVRLKWLPPIAVNIEDIDEMPAVVRPVKED